MSDRMESAGGRPADSPAKDGTARPAGEMLQAISYALRLVWSASRAQTLLLLALQLSASLLLVAQLLLITWVLDAVIDLGQGRSVREALLPLALLAVLTAFASLVRAGSDLHQRLLGELVSRAVWRQIFDVSQSVDLKTYEDPRFYDQATRVQSGAASRTQVTVNASAVVVGDMLGVGAGVVAVMGLAPLLTPLLLLSGVPLLLASRITSHREFDFAVQQSERDRRLVYLQSVMTRRDEAKEVRAFTLFSAIRTQWEKAYSEYLSALQTHVRRRLRVTVLGNLCAAALTAVALLSAVLLVNKGQLSVADAGAAIVAVRLLGTRINGAAQGLSTIYESSLFLRDLHAFLERRAIGTTAAPLRPAPDNFDELTLTSVTFQYPGSAKPALREVSLRIRRGELIALVGENGSGKTTLAKLLANLYDPDAGDIRWDGVSLKALSPESTRRRIAVLFQDFVRYQLSARDNIALGSSHASIEDAALREAARRADADEFLCGLPAGYDTILSKEYANGMDLSVGQWQRVALARAFVRDAPFVILDEPTASIDARAEHDLFARIRELFTDHTVLVISHRFSTVMSADRIYVMSDGRVVEEGDHASLVAQQGLYAELFAMQAQAYLDDRPTGK